MSDYHVLYQTRIQGKQVYIVIAHVPTADEDNVANIPLKDCILADDFINKISALPDISSVEATALAAGTLLERNINFEVDPDLTLQQARDKMDGIYSAELARIQSWIRSRYKLWGYERNVP